MDDPSVLRSRGPLAVLGRLGEREADLYGEWDSIEPRDLGRVPLVEPLPRPLVQVGETKTRHPLERDVALPNERGLLQPLRQELLLSEKLEPAVLGGGQRVGDQPDPDLTHERPRPRRGSRPAADGVGSGRRIRNKLQT